MLLAVVKLHLLPDQPVAADFGSVTLFLVVQVSVSSASTM